MRADDAVAILAELLDNSAVAVTVADLEGRFTLFNRAAELLTGYRRDEALGRPVSLFYAAPDEPQRMWAIVQREGKLEDYRTTLLDKHGNRRPISIVVTPLHDPEGRPVGTLGVTIDITERVQLEQDLEDARRRAEFYNDLMCHDIRNFGQTLLGYLELLLDGKLGALDERQRQVLVTCRRQARRTRDLIDGVRTLARLDPRRAGPLTSVRLDALVAETVGMLREAYPDRRPVISWDVPDGTRVMADELLAEVIFNLIANAVMHNPAPEPRVWVRTTPGGLPDGPSWCVNVEDDGPGLADLRRDELFERFSRLSTHGTGIGLSLVKALVESYGGRVWAEDRVAEHPEQGARFVVALRAEQP
ncbi:MAG: PAS domain-containing sensor histidine kinase [Deltaproteobacteria bacterium]|nr:PAS domain-containing sensor histidine kinase [Deltaproteobacteria bacterium]